MPTGNEFKKARPGDALNIPAALHNLTIDMAREYKASQLDVAGRGGMDFASKQASLETIVTSRLFVTKAKLEPPESATSVWLEDILPTIGLAEKIKAMLLAVFAPIRLIERACETSLRPTMDDLATIIFSSGSTGEPKGVMLSHFNIDSNVEGIAQVLHVDRRD